MLLPPDPPAGRQALEIGLVNLLPDAAMRAGERRLLAPLRAAAERLQVPLRVQLLTPPGIRAGGIPADYRTALPEHPLDGLVVTGAEPRAADLADESFWPDLAAAVDWARRRTRSTVFSCLAAHAAVLHLDGVPRRRLAAKCFGRFPVVPAAPGDYAGPVCHSRWHDLDERDLASAGYAILGRLPGGVDSFAKRVDGSRFLFLQGHPEYESGTLGREYRRDVARFLAGAGERYPDVPLNYYDAAGEAVLAGFREAALRGCAPPREPPAPVPIAEGAVGTAGAAVLGGWLQSLAMEEVR